MKFKTVEELVDNIKTIGSCIDSNPLKAYAEGIIDLMYFNGELNGDSSYVWLDEMRNMIDKFLEEKKREQGN